MTTQTAIPVTPIRSAAPSGPTVRAKRPGGVGRFFKRAPVRVFLVVLVLVELYPLFWLLMGSFKTQSEFTSNPTWSLPEQLNFENYVAAWTTGSIATNLWNSVAVTVPSLFFMLLLGVAAAYALEIMVWKGRNTILLAFVAGIMIPGQMILVPLFTVYFRSGLTSTLWPLIITYTVMGLPLTVFLMAAYFRAIPREIFEAATLDGSGMIRSFFSIGIPMMRNAIVTLALVQFFSIWNDLLIALTFTTKSSLATVQVGLLNFSDEYGSTQYGPLFAAISINVVGMLVLYLFLNKQIMAGLAAGAVKG
ncbi:raffinose/stachyose/melibiose transport system permease protein [Conyzicola lurida]|jgi:raffinose/stachyose/melibiose transport system permease protein|uniref:Raffinose/stachyose/melibiose transport system permease protein n=1 Tax=Conyzicola lurida TaxID=1172621 RepID=A0A841ASK0_9MICO|nr:carbohydrate ABC transporter permease [Conyzicola lurida]MBB5844771.1 raffinose/stachyose/melibiose transport system permease protein [Conyzicola lurida]